MLAYAPKVRCVIHSIIKRRNISVEETNCRGQDESHLEMTKTLAQTLVHIKIHTTRQTNSNKVMQGDKEWDTCIQTIRNSRVAYRMQVVRNTITG